MTKEEEDEGKLHVEDDTCHTSQNAQSCERNPGPNHGSMETESSEWRGHGASLACLWDLSLRGITGLKKIKAPLVESHPKEQTIDRRTQIKIFVEKHLQTSLNFLKLHVLNFLYPIF